MKNITLILALLSLLPLHALSAIPKPKLILIISIDQFRADYLSRFRQHFLPARGKKIGGFNYLLQKGANYAQAEYGLLQNMTCPGHATILTGSYTYQSGIPNNDWYNDKTGAYVYCAEDQTHKTVGAIPKNPHVGTSPKNLKTTTFGDELKNAYENSKVVSIALKDRSAIMMGGHRADLALWFDIEAFQWVSSTFYISSGELPDWVKLINKDLKALVGKELAWEKKLDKNISSNALVPDSKFTKDMGKTFAHRAKAGGVSSVLFPVGVTMPVELAENAITSMKLGQGKHTDVLAISFSSHDYIGHTYGPESDEIKETTVLEDKALSRLFSFLNTKVPGGLNSTWIVLTADHGVAGNPSILSKNKIPAGILEQSSLEKAIESFLVKKYGKTDKRWLLGASELNFYFNRPQFKLKEVDIAEARTEVVKYLRARPELLKGVAHVFSGTDVINRALPPEMFEKQILRTYYEGRSGDVIMIQEPNYVLAHGAATHMSGYSYDRYVPIILAGRPFRQGLYAGGRVVDIAPTLAFLAGILPPASSEGRVLKESLVNVR